jgi:hypothetical protein
MSMRFNRNAYWAVGIIAASIVTASVADARTIHHRHPGYHTYGNAYDAYGDRSDAFQYHGGNFLYGASRAPYRFYGAGSGDFQLQGR